MYMQMWDLLEWQGKHPQAPVAVAAKPYYFSELNIHQSMLNILKHHPQFFTSHQMADTIKSGDILALDQNHFCEVWAVCDVVSGLNADSQSASK